jgi:hypothetical protein
VEVTTTNYEWKRIAETMAACMAKLSSLRR